VVSRAEANLLAAADSVNVQLDEFVQARAIVWLLASADVQDSLSSLSQAIARDQDDFQTAREGFVDVARKDLGLPALPPTGPRSAHSQQPP
jgi:hypothetical protein